MHNTTSALSSLGLAFVQQRCIDRCVARSGQAHHQCAVIIVVVVVVVLLFFFNFLFYFIFLLLCGVLVCD